MRQATATAAASRRAFLKAAAATSVAAMAGPIVCAAEARPLPREIHPYPNEVVWGQGLWRAADRVTLAVGRDAEPAVVETIADTWRRFTFGAIELETRREESLRAGEFRLGGAGARAVPQLKATASYALSVGPEGAAAAAVSAAAMRHAWFTLLQLPAAEDSVRGVAFELPHVEIQDGPGLLGFRGLHLCVFHETTPEAIEKAIRLAALLKFTHVVLEFWGMLKLDAMKELAWSDAWDKATAGRLVAIARGMGLEVIPMFNCWGHAAASRIKYGRHVVLDQNPQLAPLFEPDGWTWCLTNPRAQELLGHVCDELIELAGPGEYFHIGCDEAYSHATCDRCRQIDRVKLFADHVNGMASHLERRGRRAILWGDALLERAQWPKGFEANGTPDLPTHLAIDQISRQIVIADWHYDLTQGDVPTLAHFGKRGFTTLSCPWNGLANIRTLARAAANSGSAGLLMTTWHHLPQSIPTLPYVAACAWPRDPAAALAMRQMDGSLMRAATATLLRKLVPSSGKFERAGWNGSEVPTEPD